MENNESHVNFNNINTFEISTDINTMSLQYNPRMLCIPYMKYGNCFVIFPSYLKNNNTPFFVIGPTAFLYPVLAIIILIMAGVLFRLIIIKSYLPLSQVIFVLLISCILFVYTLAVLINPGVVMNKIHSFENSKECYHCNTFTNDTVGVRHCDICNVCVEGYDHHCLWIGKCVGKGNKFLFYLMIILISVCYAYSIFLSILIFR